MDPAGMSSGPVRGPLRDLHRGLLPVLLLPELQLTCRLSNEGPRLPVEVRGHPDNDRDYRHPRTRTEKSAKQAAKSRRGDGARSRSRAIASTDDWDSLPSLDDLIDGVNRFTRYYFQLGFISKQQFPDRLRRDHRSVNLFLLLSILSISARLSPALRARYGNGVKAAEYFMERASSIAVGEIYQEPTLERCQAFYLLSIAQQGSGLRNKSYINMGISVRMAQLMQLHREETYHIQNATPELIVRAESARRTLWMLHSQDSLHSGPLSPVSLAASDITALLPCNEEDFANGREPKSRAALEGTPPAMETPALISDPHRSLFATLMQIHHLWGTVGRRAVKCGKSSRPWEENSEFFKMNQWLMEWERGLPDDHRWSPYFLRTHKANGQDLAYLCVTMMTRLCHIVLRRPYLIDIIQNDTKDPRKVSFFSKLSAELFQHVHKLYEQIDAQFSDRTPDESVGAQIAAFCVYSCGLFSGYLSRYPHICQDPILAREGPSMLRRTRTILIECKQVWPLASRWEEALERLTRDPNSTLLPQEGSMADGKDPVPQPIRQMHSLASSATSTNAPNTPHIPNGPMQHLSPLSASLPEPAIPRLQTDYPPGPPSLHSSHHNSPQNSAVTSLPPTQPSLSTTPAVTAFTPFPSPSSTAAASTASTASIATPTASAISAPTTSIAIIPTPTTYGFAQCPNSTPSYSATATATATAPYTSSCSGSSRASIRPPSGPIQHHPQPHPHHPLPPSGSAGNLPRQPAVDGLGMLIEAFDSHQQPPPYAMAVAGTPQFYQPLGPSNDGFEGELQFYIDGTNNSGWMPPDGWLEGI
ncbi:hypothetical protein PT974_09389 [Cladobotryum mycophilum]|uniref:Xylanolytic transcriptional activator regulatory domain-containing protein n=1 Tax=Cladobotryum mycophilum TaxID=491253 RepID=A0ABR0SH17_9HYPO